MPNRLKQHVCVHWQWQLFHAFLFGALLRPSILTAMLLKLVKQSPSTRVEADKVGLSAIADACQTLLSECPATIDELWAGDITDLAR